MEIRRERKKGGGERGELKRKRGGRGKRGGGDGQHTPSLSFYVYGVSLHPLPAVEL